jgi:hypothetical protein
VDGALLRQVAPVLLEKRTACKKAFGAALPAWVRRRTKTGFVVPVADWMQLPPDGTSTRMRSWARHILASSAPSGH